MILHKLSASPFTSTSLIDCLKRAVTTDKILLTQDAIYTCQLKNAEDLLAPFAPIYCINDDLIARGIKLNQQLYQAVDYAHFVELSLTCKQVISW
ncbi:sulfurtransferase complex subunit TusB [Paraglaciecola sp. L3A3]|uniref:sulfurtransferase complex subunit TusB n=1 Tax=Paraglaciecola sp. L3A3 TaxID=2686358 RepID=UPI00131A842E|nr:sulfurtransferase complex subunit TusB [Paraglaciecola sp. L3A3]